MFYQHHQNGQPTSSSSKHHDGPGGPGPNGLGAWGRHPFAPPPVGPGGMTLPTPGSFGGPGGPGGGPGGPGSNGMLGGYGGPPPPHHLQGHGPHHPSFGAGGGLHLGGGSNAQVGGGLGGMGYGMGMFGTTGAAQGGAAGGNSPPRQDSNVPLTAYWQHQLMRAEASRMSNSPHHRARSAAVASRMSSTKPTVVIADPSIRPISSASNTNLAAQATNGLHKKNQSLSVLSSTTDRTQTPPPKIDAGLSGLENPDPATPDVDPAPGTKDDDETSEPWTGLDLGGIKLRTLSTALFSFTHVTSLYINHNSLTSLPSAISQLRQLTLLDATANELTSIPPEIGVLCKLKDLLLFDNHLTTLPPEIGTLYLLETLGIEGNPLEDRLKKIIAEDGTKALITQLRDSCPVGAAPPERQWIEVEPDHSSPADGKQESFTVLTYNILCQAFAPSSTYSYTPSWALDWSYRKQTILQEIINAAADVVCLQEIDGEQYGEFFLPQLQSHGYEGAHYPRTRARTMSADEAKLVDGCAIFWKDDRFSLVETQVIEFNQVALAKTDMRTDDMFNRVMSRDNIAVTASLEFKASGARLLVANAHVYWDHRYRDVKLVQIGMLMEELEKVAERFGTLPAKPVSEPEFNKGRPPKYERLERGRDVPLILCVDTNSLAKSAVYELISDGEVAPDHEDFMTHVYGTYTNHGLRHRLGLRSACSTFGEMKMTNFTPTFEAAIDYIFYTPRSMKVTSVLGDVDRSYLDKTVGFPNAHFPSDHIPVFAQFQIKGQQDAPQVREVVHGYSR